MIREYGKKNFSSLFFNNSVFIGSAFKTPLSDDAAHIPMQRLALRTIIIDPGHGLPDRGCRW